MNAGRRGQWGTRAHVALCWVIRRRPAYARWRWSGTIASGAKIRYSRRMSRPRRRSCRPEQTFPPVFLDGEVPKEVPATHFLDGVEFGALCRQRDDADVGGYSRAPTAAVVNLGKANSRRAGFALFVVRDNRRGAAPSRSSRKSIAEPIAPHSKVATALIQIFNGLGIPRESEMRRLVSVATRWKTAEACTFFCTIATLTKMATFYDLISSIY
ncbi:hypothetical protein BH10PSE15_BH10PSE15_18320 [soil metagenome]